MRIYLFIFSSSCQEVKNCELVISKRKKRKKKLITSGKEMIDLNS